MQGDTPPPINVDVPDSVDFGLLDQISADLDGAVALNNASIPNVFDELPLDESDLYTDLGVGATLAECNQLSNQMAEDAGVDTAEHFEGTVGDAYLQHQQNVNSRRNAGLWRRRGQLTEPKPPDFNHDMETKWIEIWSASTNPSDGRIPFRTWFSKSVKEYRIWMYTQFIEAANNDLPTPQLFDVNQETVSAWVEKMKGLAARALAWRASICQSNNWCT